MKTIYRIFLIGLVLGLFFLSQCNRKEMPMQIFLCIGQSNMAGRAEIAPSDTATLDNVFLFNGEDAWAPARNPLNRYSTVRKRLSMQRLGPVWSFARKLSRHDPEMKIGLVVNARGGTSIGQWAKGEKLYNEAIIRALKAQKTGELAAVLWHQGEADKRRAAAYTEKFDSLVWHLRRDLGVPGLPVIAGQIGMWRSSADDINTVLASLGEHVEHVRTASAEGLTHLGDSSHFDTRSQLELGERYAEEYIGMLKKEKN